MRAYRIRIASGFGVALGLAVACASARASVHARAQGPCEQIKAACQGAGLITAGS